MIKVNTHEAKTRLSALLAAVEERGEVVLICRSGKPVATLSRPAGGVAPDPLVSHPELRGRILYDPTEPAGEGDWPVEER
jgi:antitoxin (DNA-binding transcriptional repressor) of toxin-antitoxin stability system